MFFYICITSWLVKSSYIKILKFGFNFENLAFGNDLAHNKLLKILKLKLILKKTCLKKLNMEIEIEQ